MIIYNKTNKSDFIRFNKGQKRCGCEYSKCFQIQCVHELVKYGTLKPDFFPKDGIDEMDTQNQWLLVTIRTH